MTVLSCEQTHGESFLVLEPFQGTPLDRYLETRGKMEPVEVLGLLRQLASALDYAHAHGSVHGCLHPSSILLNDRQEIKILDLGAGDEGALKASAEQLLRAVHFLSPECVRDEPMDGRADQFSLAVLTHYMLTGELPFPGAPLGVMFRVAYQGLERDAIRALPGAAQTVFQRSLAKRPSERYGSCCEMVETLAAALSRKVPAATRLADPSALAPVPSPAPARVQPSGLARHFSGEALKYFGLTFVAFVLVLGALYYFLLAPKAPKVTPIAAPQASQPAPPPRQPVATPAPAVVAPPPQPAAPPKPVAKSRARKKTEPEVELKPAEPKIIRQ